MNEEEILKQLKQHETRISLLRDDVEFLNKWHLIAFFYIVAFSVVSAVIIAIPLSFKYFEFYQAEKCFEHTKEAQCFFKDKE